ncbi:CocE/NonD family hydrolase [Solicola gregarius]|uniref:CocE/NonD family hydrolase n=1 Tax=Solicola gregarius TaxID=2908642 RepID=A0AA46TFW8_9ACTN|nr:CocE/NonD family hydrolase [Solicola gregarius]UYM03833.1 CocE/NonD family hydrolase [Solicola gregarius]
MRTTRLLGSLTLAGAMLVAAGVTSTGPTSAEPSAPVSRSPHGPRYDIVVTKDVPITMPDGRVLRANIHAPADPETGKPASGPFPVIVGQTPYGKSGDQGSPGYSGLNPYLVKRGYIGVVVDVAGTGGSEGQSQLFGKSEARDGREVVEWAADLPHSNGKVGLLGISYLAIDQLFTAGAVGRHSPLKAIFPMAASIDPYRDLFTSGGVVNLESSLGLIAAYFGVRTTTPFSERPKNPLDALRLSLQHALAGIPFELKTGLDVLLQGDRVYDGSYWHERAPERVLRRIVRNNVAVYLVGGQWDVFQRGEPLLYSGLQNAAAGRPVTAPMAPGQKADPRFQLLTGPWTHANPGAGARLNRLQLRWFDRWLKGRKTGILDTRKPLHVIEPGGKTYDAARYPLTGAPTKRLYLEPDGALGGKPAPADGGGDHVVFTGLSPLCTRSTDQWAAGALGDLLAGTPFDCTKQRFPPGPEPGEVAYATRPLKKATTLAGPIGVTLRARSTRPETMFVVRLDDVAPDGTVTELTGGAQLGSQRALDRRRSWRSDKRAGYALPYHPMTRAAQRPVTPGKVTRYDIEVRPAFLTVPAGHRLRMTIGTGDLPHLLPPPLRLPQLLLGVYDVRHEAGAQSWVDLPIRR